jgi:factor associated with neutral sphingomyelinase activation
LKKVGDVKLPKWAKSASDYLRLNRAALESEYVSN